MTRSKKTNCCICATSFNEKQAISLCNACILLCSKKDEKYPVCKTCYNIVSTLDKHEASNLCKNIHNIDALKDCRSIEHTFKMLDDLEVQEKQEQIDQIETLKTELKHLKSQHVGYYLVEIFFSKSKKATLRRQRKITSFLHSMEHVSVSYAGKTYKFFDEEKYNQTHVLGFFIKLSVNIRIGICDTFIVTQLRRRFPLLKDALINLKPVLKTLDF